MRTPTSIPEIAQNRSGMLTATARAMTKRVTGASLPRNAPAIAHPTAGREPDGDQPEHLHGHDRRVTRQTDGMHRGHDQGPSEVRDAFDPGSTREPHEPAARSQRPHIRHRDHRVVEERPVSATVGTGPRSDPGDVRRRDERHRTRHRHRSGAPGPDRGHRVPLPPQHSTSSSRPNRRRTLPGTRRSQLAESDPLEGRHPADRPGDVSVGRGWRLKHPEILCPHQAVPKGERCPDPAARS